MTIPKCICWLVTALLLYLECPQSVQADVIFSSLDAGGGFGTVPGWSVGNLPGLKTDQAMRFTATKSGNLDSIEAGFSLVAGAAEFEIQLVNDSAGQPGSVIETFNYAGSLPPAGSLGLTELNSSLQPMLTLGQSYWLVGTTSGADTQLTWQGTMQSGDRAFRFNNASWTTGTVPNIAAFRLNAVPEPSSMTLVVFASCTVLVRLLR